jgi:hypothetical protein
MVGRCQQYALMTAGVVDDGVAEFETVVAPDDERADGIGSEVDTQREHYRNLGRGRTPSDARGRWPCLPAMTNQRGEICTTAF